MIAIANDRPNESRPVAAIHALRPGESQRRRAEFLAVVAHELRSPLAPIRSAAALLGKGPCDEETRLRLKCIIERQVVHLARLVDDLLDLSRVETGKLALEPQLVDLREIVEAAVHARLPDAADRGQQLVSTVPASPLRLRADPVRLAQVVGNLLDNACRYTPPGGSIEIAAAASGDDVLLTVSDNGIGISAEALAHVFEPFAQETTPAGFSRKGLGLGLAVVSELVEAHGGTVIAHSAGRGQGARFVVTLPRGAVVASAAA